MWQDSELLRPQTTKKRKLILCIYGMYPTKYENFLSQKSNGAGETFDFAKEFISKFYRTKPNGDWQLSVEKYKTFIKLKEILLITSQPKMVPYSGIRLGSLQLEPQCEDVGEMIFINIQLVRSETIQD